MYDNSGTIALSGSAVTLIGHSAGLTVLTVAGICFLAVGASLAVGERLRRRRDGS